MRRKSESPNVILADRAELLPIPLINGNNVQINGTSNTAENGLSLAPSEFNTCVENVTPPRYHSRVNLESQTGNGLVTGSEMLKGQEGCSKKQLNYILPKTQIVVTKYGDHMETMC